MYAGHQFFISDVDQRCKSEEFGGGLDLQLNLPPIPRTLHFKMLYFVT
jgi:hypothetical protein